MATLLEMARANVVPGAPGSGFTYSQFGTGLQRTPETFDPNTARRNASQLAYLSSVSWDNPGKFNPQRHAQLSKEILGEMEAQQSDPANRYRNVVIGADPAGTSAAYESYRKFQEAIRQFNVQSAQRAYQFEQERRLAEKRLQQESQVRLAQQASYDRANKLSALEIALRYGLSPEEIGMSGQGFPSLKGTLASRAFGPGSDAFTQAQAGAYASLLGQADRDIGSAQATLGNAKQMFAGDALRIASQRGISADTSKDQPEFQIVGTPTPELIAAKNAAQQDLMNSPGYRYVNAAAQAVVDATARRNQIIDRQRLGVNLPVAVPGGPENYFGAGAPRRTAAQTLLAQRGNMMTATSPYFGTTAPPRVRISGVPYSQLIAPLEPGEPAIPRLYNPNAAQTPQTPAQATPFVPTVGRPSRLMPEEAPYGLQWWVQFQDWMDKLGAPALPPPRQYPPLGF